MLHQKLPEIKDSVIKSVEVIIRKRNLKSKDLWLGMQVISDSYTLVFPKSDATWLPPASLEQQRYAISLPAQQSIPKASLRKKAQIIHSRKTLVRWDTAYPHCLCVLPWKALQAKSLLKSCWLTVIFVF